MTRDEILALIEQRIATALQYSKVAVSASDGRGDASAGYPVDPANGEPTYQYPNRRMQHFGFRSRPPANVKCVRIQIGGSGANGVTVAEEDERYGPADLADGETVIYSKATGAVVKIDKDGNIYAKPAADKNVYLGDSSVSSPDGVVCGSGIDPFTGVNYNTLGNASGIVFCKK